MLAQILHRLSAAVLLIAPLCAMAQQEGVPFNGIITDVAGNPIKRARVYVTPHRIAHSDKQGHFGLTDVNPTDTVHIYYKKTYYDIPVAGRKSLQVHLGDQLEAKEDDDLVNWGYGWVKRRESLEVSSGITGEELAKSGYNSITQALQGRIPGLNVTTSNVPGEEAKLNIRGINSFYADQTPLFVVDGIVVESLEFINIHDVDKVEILKEASIYGSRGANGAILVTTKRGIK